MPISYTTIPRPSVPSYTPVSELYDDILDESGVSILDESSGKLKSEQKVDVFTSIPRPS